MYINIGFLHILRPILPTDNNTRQRSTHTKARADLGLVYEPKKQEIIVFGGWANRWFNDV